MASSEAGVAWRESPMLRSATGMGDPLVGLRHSGSMASSVRAAARRESPHLGPMTASSATGFDAEGPCVSWNPGDRRGASPEAPGL